MTVTQGRDARGLAATPLSRRRSCTRAIWAVSGLAWRSLVAISFMLFTQSCIVADPPEYRDPVRTRPLLDVYEAVPRTQEVLVAYTADLVKIQFSVPVRSEDAGEDLMALFFTDYSGGGVTEVTVGRKLIPASTYDDTSRSATFEWQPRVQPGCHLFTLVVAHRTTFRNGALDQLDTAKASDDAAIVNWWVNVDPKGDETHTLPNCPTSVSPVQ